MAPPDLPARPDRKDYARDDRSAQEYPRKERDRAGVNDRCEERSSVVFRISEIIKNVCMAALGILVR